MQCMICIICMDLPPISTYWLISPPKSLKVETVQTFICDIWSVNDIPPPCDVDLATHTLWCRLIDSESLGMDEHCGALTPSWDRLLTEGELEDGLSCPSLTTSASARPGLVATWYCTYFILILCSPRRYPFWSIDKQFKLSFRSAEYLSWIKRP